MKTKISNTIITALSVISSIITIGTFILIDLKVHIPKIDIEYICMNYGIYILILSFITITISLSNARYKTRIYNSKMAEKYNILIAFFREIIVGDEKMDLIQWECISSLIQDIYPYRKTKVNLVFEERKSNKVIYDTYDYNKWRKDKKITSLRKQKQGMRIDWRAYEKQREKRQITRLLGGIENGVCLCIYGSRAAFTRKKKKAIQPLLGMLDVLMCIVLEQQKVDMSSSYEATIN